MNRLQRAVVLVDLVEKMTVKGSWCGETHMQKAVYFLQDLCHIPTNYTFILYKHGPFSFDLRDELTGLRADDVFRLQPMPAHYGPSLRSTEVAESLKERFGKTRKAYANCVDWVAGSLGGKGAAELERLATALFVTLEQQRQRSFEDRAQRIHKLKPHVSMVEAIDAVQKVDELRKHSISVAGSAGA